MELHCTLISLRPGHVTRHAAQARREVVVDAPEGTPGSRIAEVLARDLGAQSCTLEGVPLDRLKAGEAPLVSGCVLIADGHVRGPRETPPLVLVVRTGPVSGTVVPLGRGTTRLGRSPGGPGHRCPLPDPDLSREHAEIEVTDAGVVLRDLGSANGVWLGRRKVERAGVSTGQAFRLGSSTCTLEFAADGPLLDPAAGSGPAPPVRVARHAPPSRKAATVTMVVLPLLVGVGMAVLTGMWVFLAFTAVSVVSPLIPLAEGRSARRDFARRLAAAADDDAARRRRTAPDAGLLARAVGVAPAPTPGLAEATPPATAQDTTAGLHLRLGTASVPASIVVEPAAPQGDVLPVLADAPFTVALPARLAVEAGTAEAEGLLRSLLLQLSLVPAAAGIRLLVLGGDDETRLAARYLPRVRVLPRGTTRGSLDSAGRGAAVAVVAFHGAGADLVEAAAELGWPVVGPASAIGPNPEAVVRLNGGRAQFCSAGATSAFAPDLVPAPAFEAAARRAAGRAAAGDEAGVPERCGLDELVATDPDGIAVAWERTAHTAGVLLPLGRTDGGTASLDLVSEGPHVLVAGTTGSGKSELLRSLIAGAAALHAPSRVTFLFVDFKGGSGLEPLAGLPHCVGLVTDLAEGGMDRTLASLRAELKRRERVLADARAADLGDYHRRGGGGDLPRLIVVVDEFRMLVEEAAGALSELMRVATVGRSLGMHLIMATQRPQGAISADIRANVTTNIGLRTQHDSESRDVLGSPVAAWIPVGLPGRAYLSVGGGTPVEFQSASLGVAAARGKREDVRVADALAWLEDGADGREGIAQHTPAEAAAPLVAAAVRAWDGLGGGPVRTPLAVPLPDRLPWHEQGSPDGGGGQSQGIDRAEVRLGVVDLPHEQRTTVLGWAPARDGHLALVGPSASGVSGTLAAAAAQLAVDGPCRHLYILDGDGSLAFLRDHPRVGSSVGIGEPRRAARVLARLSEECSDRLARGDGASLTPLVLVVSAWGAWVSAFRSGTLAWAEEALGGLVRDGASAGLAVIAAGHRELASSRAFSGMPARVFFPLGTTEEARMSWPRLPAMPALAGRAAAAGTLAAGGAFAMQCYEYPGREAGVQSGGAPMTRRRRRAMAEPAPFRIDPLPRLAPADRIAALTDAEAGECVPDGRSGELVIGLAGDEVRPLSLRLAPGEALLVLGGATSGKTTFIEAVPAMNPRHEFLAPRREDRARAWQSLLDRLARTGPSVDGAPVVLVDDAHRLDPDQDHVLARLLDAGASIVATAQHSANLAARCQLAVRARYGGTGIVLQPRSPNDGDFFGVRIDVPASVPSGRAVALVSGRQIETQLGVVRGAVSPADPGDAPPLVLPVLPGPAGGGAVRSPG
ncbi:hypothetical protein SCMU_26220 [Sinomonas cyclohexanicum]|uniref:DNA segregation ATPase FtsK/SpoIIIE, S-DNA-T family n=2 Tax=Sinomonas cyclohexanicum TaxID=322009 RepID=A0ABN6FKE8_SINCY|nr:hypothetical protein SCMU_26220 [Corynebacterium cyclohexanicum]